MEEEQQVHCWSESAFICTNLCHECINFLPGIKYTWHSTVSSSRVTVELEVRSTGRTSGTEYDRATIRAPATIYAVAIFA